MQPLPPDIIADSFSQAERLFASAATDLGSPDSAGNLRLGAQKLYSGIPSLRMTMPREAVGPLATALEQAAAGAIDLSKVIEQNPGDRPPEELAAVNAWRDLAGAAAMASLPPA